MGKVIDSIAPVINNSENVKINYDQILKFSESVTENGLNTFYYPFFILEDAKSEEESVMFSIIANAINFSYWGNPKWTIMYENNYYDGAFGMIYSIKNAIKNGYDILNPKYLENISETDFEKIFKGNVQIPLLAERVKVFNEIGTVLNSKYDGKALNVLKTSNYDSVKLLDMLTTDFPYSFDDKSIYNGEVIYFYKKAQLFIYDLFCLYKTNKISNEITNYDKLTMFADYKVPQMLRKLGVTEYSEHLSNLVDNSIELESGSKEEIEIRANAIWAIELIKKELNKKFNNIASADIDFSLWKISQNKSPEDKPYHKCRSAWY